VIIVNYHNILERRLNTFNKLVRKSDKKKAFEEQLLQISSRFRVVSLEEMVQAIRNARNIPRACAITFDDGYLGSYQYAVPVLERYGIPATFFLITQTIHEAGKCEWEDFDRLEAILQRTKKKSLDLTDFGYGVVSLEDDTQKINFIKSFKKQIKVTSATKRRRIDQSIYRQLEVPEETIAEYLQDEAFQMMGWEQIEDLVRRGFTVGSHTRTHSSLSQIEDGQLESEIGGSYKDLRERLGLSEMPFAYPFGKPQHISEVAMTMVQRTGYTCGLTTIKGINTPMTDVFQLRRITFKDLKRSPVLSSLSDS
jgi:peptidoglycan/xylan/chitin deacetylase (PgdA/CDA1 family)